MKTLHTLRKMRISLLLGALMMMIGLSSCEKADEIQPSLNTTTDAQYRKQMIVVEQNEWEINTAVKEAKLGCTILTETGEYKYLKVFVKVKKEDNQTDIWQELPNGTFEYQLKNSVICVQHAKNWQEERTVFLVELKLRETNGN